jgi:hypothetical protein
MRFHCPLDPNQIPSRNEGIQREISGLDEVKHQRILVKTPIAEEFV